MSKVISAITNPITSLLGIHTGNRAADTATNYQTAGMQSAQNELKPYAASGTQANTALQNQLSSGALGGNFTPGDLTKDPGYQFRLAQGEQALGRKQSAGGNYYSGQALKEAQNYGQGLADQTYNDAYSRWLQQQQNTYNMLSGQQKVGYDAAGNIGNYAAGIGNANANNTLFKENNTNKGIASFLGGFGG